MAGESEINIYNTVTPHLKNSEETHSIHFNPVVQHLALLIYIAMAGLKLHGMCRIPCLHRLQLQARAQIEMFQRAVGI